MRCKSRDFENLSTLVAHDSTNTVVFNLANFRNKTCLCPFPLLEQDTCNASSTLVHDLKPLVSSIIKFWTWSWLRAAHRSEADFASLRSPQHHLVSIAWQWSSRPQGVPVLSLRLILLCQLPLLPPLHPSLIRIYAVTTCLGHCVLKLPVNVKSQSGRWT